MSVRRRDRWSDVVDVARERGALLAVGVAEVRAHGRHQRHGDGDSGRDRQADPHPARQPIDAGSGQDQEQPEAAGGDAGEEQRVGGVGQRHDRLVVDEG